MWCGLFYSHWCIYFNVLFYNVLIESPQLGAFLLVFDRADFRLAETDHLILLLTHRDKAEEMSLRAI